VSVAEANWRLALTLVDELVRAGLTDACMAPGSRSAPLAVAMAEHPAVRLHVHLDERSAGFFALGAAKARGRPAAVLCTSGTAAANLHPAVVEADHGRVPLLVLTADRPPELRGTGANQAVDQLKLYGQGVRLFHEVGAPGEAAGTPDDGAAGRYWRSLASRAWAAATGPPAGPVHLNVAFAEPLLPERLDGEPAPGRPGGAPWTSVTRPATDPRPSEVDDLAEAVRASRRGLLVAGWGVDLRPEAVDAFAAAAGWPVLADPLSGARRGPAAISTYDSLLRVPEFAAERPDLVIRAGAGPTSKLLTAWLDQSVRQVVIDPEGGWLDPGRTAAQLIVANPSALLEALATRLADGREAPLAARTAQGREAPLAPRTADGREGPAGAPVGPAGREPSGRRQRPPASPGRGWMRRWLEADGVARRAIDEALDDSEEPFEGRVARDLVAALPDGATLLVGSSMPVRDVDAFAAPRDGLRLLANRGASGIDGLVATTLGVAACGEGPTVALLGDLALLHDAGSLLGAGRRERGGVLVVCDNDGGGIFSFLPHARLPAERFEELFSTPHGLDLAGLAAAAGLRAQRITKASDLGPALEVAMASGRTEVILVPSDRDANLARHREVTAAATAAVTAAVAAYTRATRPP
jgi:2-succinyl-5-enolpyruvyl-6-hydroxy-3-cyclohexene-1-carboxylate synthase